MSKADAWRKRAPTTNMRESHERIDAFSDTPQLYLAAPSASSFPVVLSATRTRLQSLASLPPLHSTPPVHPHRISHTSHDLRHGALSVQAFGIDRVTTYTTTTTAPAAAAISPPHGWRWYRPYMHAFTTPSSETVKLIRASSSDLVRLLSRTNSEYLISTRNKLAATLLPPSDLVRAERISKLGASVIRPFTRQPIIVRNSGTKGKEQPRTIDLCHRLSDVRQRRLNLCAVQIFYAASCTKAGKAGSTCCAVVCTTRQEHSKSPPRSLLANHLRKEHTTGP